jgi:hypothetical protein
VAGAEFDFSSVTVPTWGLLVFYALAASMVTVWLWMQGLRHVPAPQAGVFSVMLPVSATGVGVLLLGEPFTAGHAVAFVAGAGRSAAGDLAGDSHLPRPSDAGRVGDGLESRVRPRSGAEDRRVTNGRAVRSRCVSRGAAGTMAAPR